MFQPDFDLYRARYEKSLRRNEGIDTSVLYLVPKQLVVLSGKPRHFLRQCFNRPDGDPLKLTCVRRGRGPRVTLIHPLEGRRWLFAVIDKDEKKNAEAA